MRSTECAQTWERLSAELKAHAADEAYAIWEKTFSVMKVKGGTLVLGYNDKVQCRLFTDRYMNALYTAVCAVYGQMATVRFCYAPKSTKDDTATPVTPKKRGYKAGIRQIAFAFLCLLAAAAVAIVGINAVLNMSFKENFYSVSIEHTYDNFRILQLSDLHSSSFGRNNEKLLHRVTTLKPDIIVMTGDCLDAKGSVEQITALCTALAKVAPTYYIYGNNEADLAFDCEMTLTALDEKFGFDDRNRDPEKLYSADNGLREKLEATGVTVLFNESVSLTVRSNKIRIFGTLTANPSAFWQYAGEAFNKFVYESGSDEMRLFLCHDPLLLETIEEPSFGDLALCGDTHGGVWRLPRVGALYSRNFGLFPERAKHLIYGKYKVGETEVIVSSGLTNKGVVRIANQPELVVVDVNKY